MTKRRPVVIAGAGPTGLMCALALRKQGIPVVLCEAEPGLTHDLRAGAFHPPTLEMMAPYGITERMLVDGIKVRHWQIRNKPGDLIAEFDLGLLADVTPFPHRLHLEQHRLTPIQLDILQTEGGTDIRFNCMITGFTQNPDGVAVTVERDEHPRATSLEALGRLGTPFREGGTVTAGNASGVNDGAAALILASADAARKYGLTPRVRIAGAAVAGIAPRIMGMGPVPATRKLLNRLGWTLQELDVIELNEAFAVQALAVLRELGVADEAAHVNPNGGAIALGHPLGASGARLATTALYQLGRTGGRRALCTMCIGVGQGIALALERV